MVDHSTETSRAAGFSRPRPMIVCIRGGQEGTTFFFFFFSPEIGFDYRRKKCRNENYGRSGCRGSRIVFL